MALKPDSEWKNVYVDKPKDGQKCACKRSAEEGYIPSCIFLDGYFQTWEEKRNRIIITRWKSDLWLPENECFIEE